MKTIFGYLQQSGYEIGCEPSTTEPTSEDFDRANEHLCPLVDEYERTFPVIHYFLHYHTLTNSLLLSMAKAKKVGLFLRCLVLDKKERQEWALASTKDRSVKIQGEWVQYVEDMASVLRNEIPRADSVKELVHLWQRCTFETKDVTTEEDVPEAVELFHPNEKVHAFRTMVHGRSWFPPVYFSILFVVWHQPNEFPWTMIPPSLVNHKKKEILELLRSDPPNVSATEWIRICSDLPKEPLSGAKTFVQAILGRDHEDANRMYLTRTRPNWQECWTRHSWPMRRSITRKLNEWTCAPNTSDLVDMVRAMYHR